GAASSRSFEKPAKTRPSASSRAASAASSADASLPSPRPLPSTRRSINPSSARSRLMRPVQRDDHLLQYAIELDPNAVGRFAELGRDLDEAHAELEAHRDEALMLGREFRERLLVREKVL